MRSSQCVALTLSGTLGVSLHRAFIFIFIGTGLTICTHGALAPTEMRGGAKAPSSQEIAGAGSSERAPEIIKSEEPDRMRSGPSLTEAPSLSVIGTAPSQKARRRLLKLWTRSCALKMENTDFDVESGNDKDDDGQFDEDEMLKMMKNVDVAEDDEDEYFVGTSEGPRRDTSEREKKFGKKTPHVLHIKPVTFLDKSRHENWKSENLRKPRSLFYLVPEGGENREHG
ncbi:hypothetical protein ACOSQ2_026791 [Xanthoceras sorbifolium]